MAEVEPQHDEELRRLEIENMRLDIQIAEQRVRLAPWWLAVKAMTCLAVIGWALVFVMWCLGIGSAHPHR